MSRAPLPLAQLVLSAINHLLQQQSAARERMQVHAGRCIRIVINGPFGRSMHSDARIAGDGLLSLTTKGPPAAVLLVSPSVEAVFGAIKSGSSGLGPHLEVEGDVMLAAAVGEMLQSLRWDYEEDLSRVVGDSIAHRFGHAVSSAGAQARGLRQFCGEAFQRSAAAEGGPLVSAADFAAFAEEARRLSARVAELELRFAVRR